MSFCCLIFQIITGNHEPSDLSSVFVEEEMFNYENRNIINISNPNVIEYIEKPSKGFLFLKIIRNMQSINRLQKISRPQEDIQNFNSELKSYINEYSYYKDSSDIVFEILSKNKLIELNINHLESINSFEMVYLFSPFLGIT